MTVHALGAVVSPVDNDSQNSKAEVQDDGNFRQVVVVASGQGCQHDSLQWGQEPGEENQPQKRQCHSGPQGLYQLLGLLKGFAPLLTCSECIVNAAASAGNPTTQYRLLQPMKVCTLGMNISQMPILHTVTKVSLVDWSQLDMHSHCDLTCNITWLKTLQEDLKAVWSTAHCSC